jgi:hypothetical protein
MGYASNYADVIAFDTVKELCPAEAEALEGVLLECGVCMEFLAEAFQWEEPDLETLEEAVSDAAPANLDEDARATYEKEAVATITQAFKDLQTAFARATSASDSHLDLRISYHDAEEHGSRYDEIGGVFWHVEGLYQLSPAGLKFQDRVQRKSFVTFG